MIYWHRRCQDALLIAHPVGDGNALELQNWGTALMDCGGDERASQVLRSASARGMSEFLLTHFHTDHYSGITETSNQTKLEFDVEHIFLPTLPLIGDRVLTMEFALALFTMNRLLGGRSGIPEQDLIDSFTALNPFGTKPLHTFLSKGDSFHLAGTPFQVLWPPKAVSGLLAKKAKKAVEEFNAAVEGHDEARALRDMLKGYAAEAAKRSEEHAECSVEYVEDEDKQDDSDYTEEFGGTDHKITQELIDANKAIRGVANRLSLAFRCGTRLIHLGDLESAELNHVVTDLGPAKEFFGMIAAHHGTHFSSKMSRLRALHIVVSNGSRRPLLKAGYRDIASRIQETNVHGHSFLAF